MKQNELKGTSGRDVCFELQPDISFLRKNTDSACHAGSLTETVDAVSPLHRDKESCPHRLFFTTIGSPRVCHMFPLCKQTP